MVKTPHPSSHQRNGRTWRISSSPPNYARASSPKLSAKRNLVADCGCTSSCSLRRVARPPRSAAPSSVLKHHRLRGRRSLCWGGRPSMTASGEARSRCSERERERARRAFGRRGFAYRPRLAALTLELQAHRPPTVRGVGRPPGKPGDGAPRAPPARLPLEEAASRRARERLRGAHRTEKRARLEDVRPMTREEAGSFFQDETKL
jgi:hypothetical protein